MKFQPQKYFWIFRLWLSTRILDFSDRFNLLKIHRNQPSLNFDRSVWIRMKSIVNEFVIISRWLYPLKSCDIDVNCSRTITQNVQKSNQKRKTATKYRNLSWNGQTNRKRISLNAKFNAEKWNLFIKLSMFENHHQNLHQNESKFLNSAHQRIPRIYISKRIPPPHSRRFESEFERLFA